MVARGLLQNPAMFAGFKHTPVQCVKDWVRILIVRISFTLRQKV